MDHSNKKILIATGGTGGHIFPSLSLANFLKKKYKIEIVTDKRGQRYLNNNYEKINIKVIDSGTIFKKNFFEAFLSFVKIIFSFFYSVFLIIRARPRLVIGMGGYSSFPVCIAAYCLRVPILIYENNLVIGRTNKFLLPIVKKILVSTNNIQGIKPKYTSKIFLSGFLIRDNILNLKKKTIQDSDKQILSILIMGGSQSAKIFGEILPNIMAQCLENGFKIRIYQQCLNEQMDQLKQVYEKFKFEFELFSFSDSLTKYYEKVDLAITRSGASSLAELVNLRIPFVAIPLPSSADNHQFENANYFRDQGFCFLLEEKFVSDKLFEILKDLKKDSKKLLLMKEKMKNHSDKNVTTKINNLIENILYE